MASDDASGARHALTYSDALDALLALVSPRGVEQVALEQSIGHALARPIVSPVSLPPWDNAGMDGYALRRADVAGASRLSPVSLRVVGTITAGADPRALPVVAAGEAVRIMTGAPVPAGADAVIRIEDTDGGELLVNVRDTRDSVGRANVRPRGEDVAQGDALFSAGDTVRAAHVGVFASVGAERVDVYRRPRVMLLSGGDELVLLDRFAEVVDGRRIVASSTYALPPLLRAAGADVTVAPLVPDTLADTMHAIELAMASSSDVLITTGGVSVGAHDYTREALVQLGGTIDFWRAKIRPGGPIGVGRMGSMTWIGLPGNPVSSMVTATLFAWPMLRKLGGHSITSHRTITTTFRDHYDTPAALTYFVRVSLTRRDDGGFDARLSGPQGSNLLHTIAVADALMMVPEEVSAASDGDTFDVVLLT